MFDIYDLVPQYDTIIEWALGNQGKKDFDFHFHVITKLIRF